MGLGRYEASGGGVSITQLATGTYRDAIALAEELGVRHGNVSSWYDWDRFVDYANGFYETYGPLVMEFKGVIYDVGGVGGGINAVAVQAIEPEVFESVSEPEESVQTVRTEEVTCAADVRQCWDGSYVRRVGPDCRFEGCPPQPEPVTTAVVDTAYTDGPQETEYEPVIAEEVVESQAGATEQVQPSVEGQEQSAGQISTATGGSGTGMDVTKWFEEGIDFGGTRVPGWLVLAVGGLSVLLLLRR